MSMNKTWAISSSISFLISADISSCALRLREFHNRASFRLLSLSAMIFQYFTRRIVSISSIGRASRIVCPAAIPIIPISVEAWRLFILEQLLLFAAMAYGLRGVHDAGFEPATFLRVNQLRRFQGWKEGCSVWILPQLVAAKTDPNLAWAVGETVMQTEQNRECSASLILLRKRRNQVPEMGDFFSTPGASKTFQPQLCG